MITEQATLFEGTTPSKENIARMPLAARMRARTLNEVVGQDHLLSEDCLLPKLIKSDQFGSLLFYGPPGSGKTTLAEVIAQQTSCRFVKINAVLSNVAELRDILRMARHYDKQQTLLFIDEIHRFNKAQQDLLLPDIEAGNIRLIGATTHNPGFYIIPPLLSRSHLFRLEPLHEEVVAQLLELALSDKERGLGHTRCTAEPAVFTGLAMLSGGDLRRALNSLETLVLSQAIGSAITEETVEQFAKERQIRYDRDGEEHYDTISAYIKSIRGSDPDAALYWLAKMLEGGEDPRFIARRLVILASEDVGLADSRGLGLATAAFQACEMIGMPECALNLSHVTIFLATAPKSNSACESLFKAYEVLKSQPVQLVPKWLRDGKSTVGRRLGNGKDYQYSHNEDTGITGQEYLEKPLTLYTPKAVGAEAAIAERLEAWKALKKEKQGAN